ncbi:MAG: MBL fold metallo-hydrolase, partial [Cyclobacteriaceae bacterium]
MTRLMIIFFLISGALSAQNPFIIVLGNVQDGGSPHIGCSRECCSGLHESPDPDRMVVSLGLVDPSSESRYLIEATPDMPRQLQILNKYGPYGDEKTADGIFLTHAHIGHYTGLMYLGKEALNSSGAPVFAMPRMAEYLRTNGPWSQLVKLGNIDLRMIRDGEPVHLTDKLQVTPIRVPHRDEYSETVGFFMKGPSKTALFIPDIDK